MADFYEDYLVEGTDGLYHITTSISPENAPKGTNTWLSKDATMDVAIAREVFTFLCDMGRRFHASSAERKDGMLYCRNCRLTALTMTALWLSGWIRLIPISIITAIIPTFILSSRGLTWLGRMPILHCRRRQKWRWTNVSDLIQVLLTV